MGVIGFEPIQPKGTGFTDQLNSPTLTHSHLAGGKGIEPLSSGLEPRMLPLHQPPTYFQNFKEQKKDLTISGEVFLYHLRILLF